MLEWLKKLFGSTAKKEDTQTKVTGDVVIMDGDEVRKVASTISDIFALNPDKRSADYISGTLASLAQNQPPTPDPAPDPAQPPEEVPVPAPAPVPAQPLDPDLASPAPALASPAPALDPDQLPVSSPVPAPAFDDRITGSISTLVESIFKQDVEDALKNYFFSIFMPPEDPVDDKKKSTASTPSTAPNLTSDQKTELRETLAKCASAYINDGSDLPPSGPSDPKSNPTKTTSKLSQILKEKAEPEIYFGVGIKTELEASGDEKFLKITDIFKESKLHKDNQGGKDYTNQFITHLNCKLGNDTEIKEYSITDIFDNFKNDPNPQGKFDEKIDQIFRDINQTSIKFKISASKSQTDPATQPADVTVDKIIFEKTKGVYQQKTMKPSTTTVIRDAEGRGVEAGEKAGAAV